MHERYCLFLVLLGLFVSIDMPLAAGSSSPDVTLVSPPDGNVSNSGNMTCVCNASDDENIYRILLYADTGSGFSLRGTRRVMELENDSNSLLLCRFDGDYTCAEGEEGTNSSTSFETSRFVQGVFINDSDTLTYPAAGNLTFFINASCAENVTGFDSEIVGVSCSSSDGVCGTGCSYVTDDDCSVPSGGGGGETGTTSTGGGSAVYEYGIRIKAPSRMDIYRGERKYFCVNVSNTGKNTVLKNVILAVSGYPQTHISVSPSRLLINESSRGTFTVGIFAPDYMKYGEYGLILAVSGEGTRAGSGNITRVRDSAGMVFAVHSIHENETLLSLKNAELSLKEMRDANIPALTAGRLFKKAKRAYDEWNYDEAKRLADEIVGIKELAFTTSSLISQIEKKRQTARYYGLETPETDKLYTLSVNAFQREDYERAKSRANNALLAFAVETGSVMVILEFIYN